MIELMITIAIFSITLTFGVSSYRTWIQNSQIRNAAESIQNGIQKARGEAVKRNANVEFSLLDTASSWQIDLPGSAVIETRSSGEGSKNVTVSAAVDNSGNTATTITFNSVGTIADPATSLARIDLSSSVATTSLRPLRVTIGLGGSARVCDPSLDPTTSTDPRRCY